jgi:hypothetical protein
MHWAMAACAPDISSATPKPSEILARHIDGADIGHLCRQAQAEIVAVGQDYAAGAGAARYHRGHYADGARTGDQHILAHQVELLHGVHGIAEGVEQGADFEIQILRQRHDIEGRQREIFRKGTLAIDPDALGMGIEVKLAGPRRRGIEIDDMAFARDALPHGQRPGHALADLHDLAGEFMAGDHGGLDGFLGPFVPVVDVQVGAADGGAPHADQHVLHANAGCLRLDHGEARGRVGLGKGFHLIFSSRSRTRVKALTARSTCSTLWAADSCVRMRA